MAEKKKSYIDLMMSKSDVERAECRNANSIKINLFNEKKAKHIGKIEEYKSATKDVKLGKKFVLIASAMVICSLCAGVPLLFGLVVAGSAFALESQFNLAKRLFHRISSNIFKHKIEKLETKQRVIELVNEQKLEDEKNKEVVEESTQNEEQNNDQTSEKDTQEVKSEEELKNNTKDAETLADELDFKDDYKESKDMRANKENAKSNEQSLDSGK